MITHNGRPSGRRWGRRHRDVLAANDNAAASDVTRIATPVGAPAEVTPDAVNDNEAAAVPPIAANDNDPTVVDDLPRPLPVIGKEGEIIRALLGNRLLKTLLGDKQ